MKVTLCLPMPHADLSPNTKCHWAKKSKAVKKHRRHANLTAKACLKIFANKKVESYQLHFTFPNHIRRDFDNFTARCKSYLDGISDFFQQDDSEWNMMAPTKEINKGSNVVKITLNLKE